MAIFWDTGEGRVKKSEKTVTYLMGDAKEEDTFLRVYVTVLLSINNSITGEIILTIWIPKTFAKKNIKPKTKIYTIILVDLHTKTNYISQQIVYVYQN